MNTLATDRGDPDPAARALNMALALEPLQAFAIFLIDRNGRIASWNAGVERILGWSRNDWLGQPLQVAFTPEDREAGVPTSEINRAAAVGCSEDTRWMQRRDDSHFYARGTMTRIQDEHGHIVGYLKALRDDTSQFENERLLSHTMLLHDQLQARAQHQAAMLAVAIDSVTDGVFICDRHGVRYCNRVALPLLGVATLDEALANDAAGLQGLALRAEPDGATLAAAHTPLGFALSGHATQLDLWSTHPMSRQPMLLRWMGRPVMVDQHVEAAVVTFSPLTKASGPTRLQTGGGNDLRHEPEGLPAHAASPPTAPFASAQRTSDSAIFNVDKAGRISSWHPGAQALMGYSAQQVTGTQLEQLFTEEDRALGKPAEELNQAEQQGESNSQGLRRRQDGSTFDAAMLLTALRSHSGECLGFLALVQNITERCAQDRALEVEVTLAQTARAAAERASQAKDEFLATISHELRTPLSAIVGWADVLQRGVSDEETVRHGLAAISRNARMQGQLVEDLLDMSRMEAGKLRMELHPVELGAVVAAAVDACLPSATQKEVGLRTAFGCSGSVVMADARRLQQVVCSLLNNAIKFSTPGDQIDIRLSQEESLACITVCDSGQGIEPAFLPRVFDRFQQQDGSKTRRHGGLGLGLAIVRQLVQLHGGQVQVHSAGVGLGASFTVSLPLLHTVAVPVDLVEGSPAASGAAVYDMLNRLEGLHVLLVDDEFDTREITGQLLGRAGAQVTLAASAVAAWKAVDEHLPDVIVSDIGMPGIDGYEFMRGLRQRPAERGGNTPALAFTAYAREEDREAALAAGFHSHLSKPAMQGELVEALAALMKTV